MEHEQLEHVVTLTMITTTHNKLTGCSDVITEVTGTIVSLVDSAPSLLTVNILLIVSPIQTGPKEIALVSTDIYNK